MFKKSINIANKAGENVVTIDLTDFVGKITFVCAVVGFCTIIKKVSSSFTKTKETIKEND